MPADVRSLLRFRGGSAPALRIPPDATPGIAKREARQQLADDEERLRGLQERLFAEGKRALLVVIQGMDTSGKDAVVKHVFGAMDPQGVRVTAFKKPTDEELRHDFLWRIRRALPHAGQVGIFNRSHYEDVLVVRVHGLVPRRVWARRYATINAFEREISRSGTTIVKVFLYLSFEEQRKRLLDRLRTPDKRWKFNPNDLAERALWPAYMEAYADALAKCSSPAAPWYVIPSDHEWYRDWAIGRILVATLERMRPRYPRPRLDIRGLEARLRTG